MSRPLAMSLLALGLVSCMDGPSDETLVDDVRVVAIQAEPPEVAPGQEVRFEVLVADPLDQGAELLFWHCTPTGAGCLEQGTEHVWTPALEDQRASVTATVPAALAALATEVPVQATVLWALACAPGVCPQIADHDAWDLSDPSPWLADLPFEGVSPAFSTLAISTRVDAPGNPGVERTTEEPVVAAPEEEVELSFAVSLDVDPTADTLAFGYATAGGFGATEYAIGDDGEVALTWYAPEDPGTVDLYVVVNDGQGGVGVWTGEATVE